MKVVLFCGGLGMRLRAYDENVPKPMVPVGYRPILWHVMKYYAHFGHKDFILCLGYRADAVKQYFLHYDECLSNDFVLSGGGKDLDLLARDIDDWRITFCDTGLHANIGERLWAVREHLAGEEAFLANYADGLANLYLPDLVDFAEARRATACFASVQPTQSVHVVRAAPDGRVEHIRPIGEAGLRINGGYFYFRREIFDYLGPGEELVHAPFERLIAAGRLVAYPHDGFWACMDTFKEKQLLDDLYAQGTAPWELWKPQRNGRALAHA